MQKIIMTERNRIRKIKQSFISYWWILQKQGKGIDFKYICMYIWMDGCVCIYVYVSHTHTHTNLIGLFEQNKINFGTVLLAY